MSTGPQTPPPPPGPRGLMDEHEVASYLNIPIGTFRRMRAKRDCPRITKIGKRLLWDFADVREYVEQKKEKAPRVMPATPPPLSVVTARGVRGRAA